MTTLKALARLNAEAGEAALAVDLLERALAIQIEVSWKDLRGSIV